MTKSLMILALGAVAVGVAACGSAKAEHDHGAMAGDAKCPMCAAGKSGDAVWCEACKQGFVDGHEVGCHACFDSMKAGGGACPMCVDKMAK